MGAWLAVRAFDLHEPATADEAVGLLQRLNNSALIAGGAVLTFLLRERLAAPDHLVSLTGIPELAGIARSDGHVTIGATTTLREIERSTLLPVLSEAAHLIGNIRVRNVATLGGHLAQADIHLDLPPVLVALGAEVDIQGPDGRRTVPVSEFFLGYYETCLEPAEMVTGVRVPDLSPDLKGVYLKYCALSQNDWPTLGVAAFMQAADGRASDVRVVAGAVSDRPLRVPEAEALLENKRPTASAIAEVGRRYAAAADPVGDATGSAQYKREVTAVYVRRAIEAVAQRAGLR